VNILASPRARLGIEVVHDLVCPWCYLGIHRLLRTLRQRPDLLTDITWRPFLLNPDMPRAGVPRAEYMVRKFGGEERARRLYASITAIAEMEGLRFRFDRIRRTPSSVDAHRLVRQAGAHGRGTEMVMALFEAHFTDGRDIGDVQVLADLAAAHGFNGPAIRAFLASDADTDTVHADNLRAHRLGINGVPCFIVGARHAIAGAQEPEVIERLLDVALVDAAECPGG
jgi:predicted DsbA family dithiol-disulfide isomerase